MRRLLDRLTVAGLTLLVLGLAFAQAGSLAGTIKRAGGPPATSESSGIQGLDAGGVLLPLLRADLGGPKGNPSITPPDGLPVKASLWLAPIASLGGGAGLNWYEMSDLAGENGLPGTDEAKHEFRVRLGGGLMVPLTPSIGLDLRGGAY